MQFGAQLAPCRKNLMQWALCPLSSAHITVSAVRCWQSMSVWEQFSCTQQVTAERDRLLAQLSQGKTATSEHEGESSLADLEHHWWIDG